MTMTAEGYNNTNKYKLHVQFWMRDCFDVPYVVRATLMKLNNAKY